MFQLVINILNSFIYFFFFFFGRISISKNPFDFLYKIRSSLTINNSSNSEVTLYKVCIVCSADKGQFSVWPFKRERLCNTAVNLSDERCHT
jgi:hypothetical protein